MFFEMLFFSTVLFSIISFVDRPGIFHVHSFFVLSMLLSPPGDDLFRGHRYLFFFC